MQMIVTKAEAKEYARLAFNRLKPGALFNFWLTGDGLDSRHALAVHQVNPDTWKIIELTPDNRKNIMVDMPAIARELHQAEITCMNILDNREVA